MLPVHNVPLLYTSV